MNHVKLLSLKWLNKHAPLRKKLLRANHALYIMKTLREKIMCRGQVKNLETSEISEFFFWLFLFWLFDFGLILKIENSEEKNSENKFWRFRVFNLPFFNLTFSSDRLSFFTLYDVFCFLFLHCFNLLFRLLDCDYPICKSMFKVTQIKSNVYHICSKLKKLTKLISVTGRFELNFVWFELWQVNLHNL